MKLVIDIPDDKWKSYQPYKGLPYDNIMDNSVRYIADGTPLPKGHGRLIDADDIDYIADFMGNWTSEERIKNTSPTIIEADGGGADDR